MDKENDIVREAQTLNSEMQTLVYENYNKFISATETIKKVSDHRVILLYQQYSKMQEASRSIIIWRI